MGEGSMQTKLDFLIERVQKQNPQANIKKIRAAYECAAKAHEGQKRRNGEPYIIHPSLSPRSLWRWGWIRIPSVQRCCMTALRTPSSATRRSKTNSARPVAELVDGVTRLGMLRYSKEQEQFEDLRKMSSPWRRISALSSSSWPTDCTMPARSSSCPSVSSATRHGNHGDLRADRAPSRHEPHQVGA